jgi:excisionase family DNA binding protein
MYSAEPFALSIPDVIRLSAVGRSTVYKAIGAGDLPIRKVGRRTIILASDLKSWLEQLPSPSPQERAA